MEGESSGVQQAQDQGRQEQGVGTQQKQGQQAPQEDQVSEGDGTDYVAQLKAKDAEMEALISWLCAKRWCQHLGKGMRPPPRIFSCHAETIGDSHKDTVAHEAPAMPPARTCRPPTRAPSTSGGWPTGWCWCSLRSGPSDHWEMSTVSTKN